MNIHDNIHTAILNLRANKTRSSLSMLGVVIGTAAVILVVAMVNGTREETLEQMRAGKENMLILRAAYSEATGRFGKISIEDVQKLKKLPDVLTAFPDMIQEVNARGTFGKARLVTFAVDHHYTDLYGHKLVKGRFFTKDDTDGRPRICLVSDRMAEKLFGFDYPVGQKLRLEFGPLSVVGIFKAEERLKKMGQHGDVLIPLYTNLQMIKMYTIYSVQIRARPGRIEQAKETILSYFVEKKVDKNTIELVDVRDYHKETEKWAQTWLLQMALIAGISLLVGGVGLMNVMLTTVAERTHEIGLRKAIGADSQAILHQFLVEAVTLSGLGGVSGILMGIFLSYALNVVSGGKILISILPVSIVVSFLFSLLLGVIFGLFPASKAAHLSPVDALRYE